MNIQIHNVALMDMQLACGLYVMIVAGHVHLAVPAQGMLMDCQCDMQKHAANNRIRRLPSSIDADA